MTNPFKCTPLRTVSSGGHSGIVRKVKLLTAHHFVKPDTWRCFSRLLTNCLQLSGGVSIRTLTPDTVGA